jgi:hypothetical protein
MAQLIEADKVVFKKLKRLAPDFHQHIVKSQVLGNAIKAGDRMLVYEVNETVPDGRVLVTNHTEFEFC